MGRAEIRGDGFRSAHYFLMPPRQLKAQGESDTHRIKAAQSILRKKRIVTVKSVKSGEFKSEYRIMNKECRMSKEGARRKRQRSEV
jgi:hypothetical protein